MTSRPMVSSWRVVTPARIASRMHECISATTPPARRMRAISSLLRLTRWPASPGQPANVDLVDETPQHVVGRPEAVDHDEHLAVLVPRDQRCGLLLVERQP